jgi:hypothetical protein
VSSLPCGCTLPRGPFCDDHRREFFGEEPVTDADRFLILIRDNPTLLPAAPVDTAAAMEHRARDEVHACLRCGKRAQSAFIAATKLGNRWLDLCAACAHWLRTAAT